MSSPLTCTCGAFLCIHEFNPTTWTYQGSLLRYHGKQIHHSQVERTVDDGSLLGFDYLTILLEDGTTLRNVRETSIERTT